MGKLLNLKQVASQLTSRGITAVEVRRWVSLASECRPAVCGVLGKWLRAPAYDELVAKLFERANLRRFAEAAQETKDSFFHHLLIEAGQTDHLNEHCNALEVGLAQKFASNGVYEPSIRARHLVANLTLSQSYWAGVGQQLLAGQSPNEIVRSAIELFEPPGSRWRASGSLREPNSAENTSREPNGAENTAADGDDGWPDGGSSREPNGAQNTAADGDDGWPVGGSSQDPNTSADGDDFVKNSADAVSRVLEDKLAGRWLVATAMQWVPELLTKVSDARSVADAIRASPIPPGHFEAGVRARKLKTANTAVYRAEQALNKVFAQVVNLELATLPAPNKGRELMNGLNSKPNGLRERLEVIRLQVAQAEHAAVCAAEDEKLVRQQELRAGRSIQRRLTWSRLLVGFLGLAAILLLVVLWASSRDLAHLRDERAVLESERAVLARMIAEASDEQARRRQAEAVEVATSSTWIEQAVNARELKRLRSDRGMLLTKVQRIKALLLEIQENRRADREALETQYANAIRDAVAEARAEAHADDLQAVDELVEQLVETRVERVLGAATAKVKSSPEPLAQSQALERAQEETDSLLGEKLPQVDKASLSIQRPLPVIQPDTQGPADTVVPAPLGREATALPEDNVSVSPAKSSAIEQPMSVEPNTMEQQEVEQTPPSSLNEKR